MSSIAEAVRTAIVPFLAATVVVLGVLVAHVVVLHVVRELSFRRRESLTGRYGDIVTAVLFGEDAGPALAQLKASPLRDRPLIATLILQTLRVAQGSVTARARWVAEELGFIAQWRAALGRRREWVRAEAAHALGLVQCASAGPLLVAALDDRSREVRAAAVEALGLIGDPDTIPELVRRLSDQARHSRVRLMLAIRQFGSAAVERLLERDRESREDRPLLATVLGSIGAASALSSLLDWTADERLEVRAAALRAIGTIGVDDRSYYYLLRALTDDAADVRAAAAWALGRSGREAAVPYLAPRLHDDWVVASHSARALRDLGVAGRLALTLSAAEPDGELARQMLWECAPAIDG